MNNIVNVDFRYVLRYVEFRDPYDPATFRKKVPVLQWRSTSLEADGAWSEWRDVRTEEE